MQFKQLAIGIVARLLVPLIILALLAAALFFLQTKKSRFTVWSLGPEETIFINGMPLKQLENYVPLSPYRVSYRDYSDAKSYRITIKRDNVILYEDAVAPGSYIINATSDSWVSAEVVSYSSLGDASNPYRSSGSYKIVPPSPLGVYRLSGDAEYYKAFDFSKDPMSSISSSGNGRRSDFIQLATDKL